MAGTMTGKVVLVTGGSSGIGRATCVRFAREGATVVLAARRSAEGEQTAQMVREAGGDALFLRADIAQPGDIQGLVHTCEERYGRLDYACNNAGIEGTIAPLVEYTEAQWDMLMAINLKGTWLCMKAEISPHAGPRRRGDRQYGLGRWVDWLCRYGALRRHQTRHYRVDQNRGDRTCARQHPG